MAFVIDPKPQHEALKEATCRDGCGAKIGYVPNDIRDGVHYDYLGDGDHFNYVNCPQCGKQIYVKR